VRLLLLQPLPLHVDLYLHLHLLQLRMKQRRLSLEVELLARIAAGSNRPVIVNGALLRRAVNGALLRKAVNGAWLRRARPLVVNGAWLRRASCRRREQSRLQLAVRCRGDPRRGGRLWVRHRQSSSQLCGGAH
jgi:hypothetical protein